jgi:Pyruvate/2-oxoacid:ferredoxin oxidoreductase delta subunit
VDLLAERGAGPEVAGFDRIRLAWHRPAPPAPRGRVDPLLRRRDDREVRRGFAGAEARDEAARCLSCGTCSGCDVCHGLCPDRAVVRGPPGAYAVDASRCKGCGICAEECPRGAVELRDRGEG